MRNRHVSILGAGQCGTLLATMLAKREFKVSLFERNADPRIYNAAAAGERMPLISSVTNSNAA